ncbi:hypothetical protein PtA15_8A360 [Puccinia triticina]|uniref:SET domain-containing protein n=1 Tax=Puccinia triticina TaxID=208348 RepID=A0ABY7CQB9_9BASI|nr:uncharacterized protein PtA15_8A360 [Puccinia triticina]WAQ87456.1 hypothetical protein PtA15_8A360 [Puccinia triticina]WAR57310.1 hypothetical protein PtB15_8B357 [Puccinia triticina]
MSFRSPPMALVQCVLQLWLAVGPLASLESFSSFPLVGFQFPALPASNSITTPIRSIVPNEQEDNHKVESPFKSRHYVYDYSQVTEIPIEPSDDNPSQDGFTKQRCYPGSDPTEEQYCVYANPSFGEDRGMVLYIRPSHLLKKLDSFTIFKHDSHLLTDKRRAEFPYKLVHMPTKGGLGAVADRKINIGEVVIEDYSLIVITADISEIDLQEWAPRLKYMVDLLPIKGHLNHDCRPNVGYVFNNVTLQVEMHALREIAPGEELTISYIKLVQSREKRRAKLHHTYGFHCGCSQCSLSDAESAASDLRLEKLIEMWDVVADWEATPPPSPAMAEEIIEIFKTERMDVVMEEPYTMAALVYNSWGLTHEARKYASLAISYGAYVSGKTWIEESPHLSLIYDPENHWSYNIRKEMESGEALSNSANHIHTHAEL